MRRIEIHPSAGPMTMQTREMPLSGPSLVQGLAHRVGRGAMTPREIGDHKPFVGGEPSLDDVFPDQFIKRGALAGRPDCIRHHKWLGFEIACVGQGRLPDQYTYFPISHIGFYKQCTIQRVDRQSTI